MFDDTITMEANHHDQDVAEFAMVGSAGISGHKTALKEISAYAPNDNDPFEPLKTLAIPTSAGVPEEGQNTPKDRLFEDLVDMNMMDQSNLFLQAEDFGRAMNDWINFDMSGVS